MNSFYGLGLFIYAVVVTLFLEGANRYSRQPGAVRVPRWEKWVLSLTWPLFPVWYVLKVVYWWVYWRWCYWRISRKFRRLGMIHLIAEKFKRASDDILRDDSHK